MAEVFLAIRQGGSNTRYVLKRILPHLESKKDFVQMFIDEARLTRIFDHPNLVRVEDFGQAEGVHFIVMEYVDGVPFSSLIKHAGTISHEIGSWLIAQICSALAYVHEQRDAEGQPLWVIHRDVSPDNILLSRYGDVKLSDFGIAKARIQLTRTRPGQIKGKFAYMSPEQSLEGDLDHRSDIFAAGLVLYEATTGRRVFNQQLDVDVLHALATQQYTPPDKVCADYPAELTKIVNKALSWDPDARYQRAGEFADSLRAFVSHKDHGPHLASLVANISSSAPEEGLDAPVTQGASDSIDSDVRTGVWHDARPPAPRDTLEEKIPGGVKSARDTYGPDLLANDTGSLTTPFGVEAIDDDGIPTPRARSTGPLERVSSDDAKLATATPPDKISGEISDSQERVREDTSNPGEKNSDETSLQLDADEAHFLVAEVITRVPEARPTGSVYLDDEDRFLALEGFPWGWVIVGLLALTLLGTLLISC
ncbi:MAG: serine/threonine protein kinase [Deltaproteobacteria bacterium]|nr:serine/threonine protein kinase [Deltaproteobacteria bacterium]